MTSVAACEDRDYAGVALYSLLFVFFFQMLSDFIGAAYARGLTSLAMPADTGSIALLLSSIVLIGFGTGLKGRTLVCVGEAMLLARIVEPMLDTRARMVAAGLGCGCFLVLLPSLVWNWAHNAGRNNVAAPAGGASGAACGLPGLAGGIFVAMGMSLLFRALGSGLDITTWSYGQWAGWALAGTGAVLMLRLAQPGSPGGAESGKDQGATGGFARVLGLTLGLMGAIALLYMVFAAANVVTRWTDASYSAVVFLLMLSLAVAGFLLNSGRTLAALLSFRLLLGWNVVFVTAMVLTILMHQVTLPSDVGAYPIAAPPVSPFAHVTLVVMLLSWPVVLLDFVAYAREIVALKPSHRALAASFTLASVYLIAIIFAHIFTTVYDYIPGIGPYFRDRFWAVHLALGIVLVLPLLLLRKTRIPAIPFASSRGWPWAVCAISIITVAVAIATAAKPVAQADGKRTLRIVSYNIQQGYSEDGELNCDGQLEVLRKADADIIGLQESDTNRIAGGNCDVVRYYADALDMYSYYGPSPVTGTFGVALLSKYPIRNAATFFLFSHGQGRHDKEQTAAIEAEVPVGDKMFNVVVTHLGNRGPVYQQQEILGRLTGKDNVLLMGDFNFRPSSDSYNLTTQSLEDSWASYWKGDVEGREVDPMDRIDHIFVSPGARIKDSRFLTGPQSDHPAIVTEVEW